MTDSAVVVDGTLAPVITYPRVLGDNVLIRMDEATKFSPGGIIRANRDFDWTQPATVLAVGNGLRDPDTGARTPIEGIRPGDRIVFSYRPSKERPYTEALYGARVVFIKFHEIDGIIDSEPIAIKMSKDYGNEIVTGARIDYDPGADDETVEAVVEVEDGKIKSVTFDAVQKPINSNHASIGEVGDPLQVVHPGDMSKPILSEPSIFECTCEDIARNMDPSVLEDGKHHPDCPMNPEWRLKISGDATPEQIERLKKAAMERRDGVIYIDAKHDLDFPA